MLTRILSTLMEDGKLESILCGGMEQSIQAHGPITRNLKSSAAKRAASHARSIIREIADGEIQENPDHSFCRMEMERLRKEMEDIQKKNNKLRGQVSYWMNKARELEGATTCEASSLS